MSERSKRILKSIEDAGLSYGELSRLTDIPKSALQRYAIGETEKIPLDRLEKIAHATGVSSAFLMGWEVGYTPYTSDNASLVSKTIKDPQYMKLLHYFDCLNEIGKEKALGNLEDLAKIYNE